MLALSLEPWERRGLNVQGERYFYGHENGVCSADYTDDYGTLLDGFLSVFDLEDTPLR